MITYRPATDNDFDFTFQIKTNSTKEFVEKIWGWDNTVQLDYHKKQFDPIKIKIILDQNRQVGYLSAFSTDTILFIESILIDTPFQGQKIGTKVMLDIIGNSKKQKKSVELQVLKINGRAKKFYERLNFQTFGQTELHYKMRYE